VKKKEHISKKDKLDWEKYTKNPKDIFDKELEVKKADQKIQRFRFDLHGFSLLEANLKIKELIRDCQEKGFREILLITGKGLHSNSNQNTYVSKDLSKLKFAVPEFINTQKELSDKVHSIDPAEISDGGEGALIIRLKKL
jgi:DNA-nicking Smr family endonuclease